MPLHMCVAPGVACTCDECRDARQSRRAAVGRAFRAPERTVHHMTVVGQGYAPLTFLHSLAVLVFGLVMAAAFFAVLYLTLLFAVHFSAGASTAMPLAVSSTPAAAVEAGRGATFMGG